VGFRYVFRGAFEGVTAAAGCAAAAVAAMGTLALGDGAGLDAVGIGPTADAAGIEWLAGAAVAIGGRDQKLRANKNARERASGHATQTALATKRRARNGSFLRRGFGAILRSASRNSGDSVMTSVGIPESES
jgi:hypothetical protein